MRRFLIPYLQLLRVLKNLDVMIDLDLPKLQSITLGWNSLYGSEDDESCSLVMRSNNKMIRNDCT